MRKQFAVLGLGSFGRSVALTLENMGCDVIVVDKSRETIQEIADRVTYAITADITEKEASEYTWNKEFGRSNYWSCGES